MKLFSLKGFIHFSVGRFKTRYQVIPPSEDLYYNLDAVKVADVLLIVHPIDKTESYSLDNCSLLTCIYNHCLPTTMHVVVGLEYVSFKKRSQIKKEVQNAIEHKFPGEKVHKVDNSQELLNILQLLSNCKKRKVNQRNHHSYILAEDVKYESANRFLKVKGFVRNYPLDVNQLVHIPGWNNYQIESIQILNDPYALREKKINGMIEEDRQMIMNLRHLKPDPMLQETLESENPIDPMEGEQTYISPEELAEAEAKAKKKVVRVPKGTSDYQASWIIEEANEDREGFSESDDDVESNDDNLSMVEMDEQSEEENEVEDEDFDDDTDFQSVTVTEKDETENYDEKMNIDEENEELIKFKEAREHEMFPDEIDTPLDQPARVRFGKYRGLKSFTHSPWDPKENLCFDYSRIFQFQNFNQTYKRIKTKALSSRFSVEPGYYVEIILKEVPLELMQSHQDTKNNFLLLYGLLPHEEKMSVINVVINKQPNFTLPIKSKEELIIHLGFRRFTNRPIFSAHTNGDKFKLERYLPADVATVATFYAPITFPPASVLVFKKFSNGEQSLVATGSLLSVNPNRVIIKRIRLSGHPFKIVKKSTVVRYMFFNREDILWFKPIELRTKYGRKGHIREPLGTHGHMKCKFDRQLPSNDTVLMNLYKRVFPKWHFNPNVDKPLQAIQVD